MRYVVRDMMFLDKCLEICVSRSVLRYVSGACVSEMCVLGYACPVYVVWDMCFRSMYVAVCASGYVV